MPETYNPQERTFIKKPENKVCITCGQPIMETVRPMTNEMSRYVNKISGKEVAFNSADDIIEIQGVKLYRKGSKAELDYKAPPAAPATPPKP